MFSGLHVTPWAVCVEEHKQIRGSIAPVLVVDPSRSTWRGCDRDPGFSDQLYRRLIETHHWTAPVRAFGVEVEDILHAANELAVDGRDAPHLTLPRLQFVLFQAASDGFP